MSKFFIGLSCLVIGLLAGIYISDNKWESRVQMAGGNYVLAAVISQGPKAGRVLFCCREADAFKVVPEMTGYHVEFATREETRKYIEENGTHNQWVATK